MTNEEKLMFEEMKKEFKYYYKQKIEGYLFPIQWVNEFTELFTKYKDSITVEDMIMHSSIKAFMRTEDLISIENNGTRTVMILTQPRDVEFWTNNLLGKQYLSNGEVQEKIVFEEVEIIRKGVII
jgi:hypothetical protein